MFQDMSMIKPPHIGREKPWHQDQAYFKTLPLRTGVTVVVGAWIALDDVTVKNGCMMVLPSCHTQGPFRHVRLRDWQLCDSHVLERTVNHDGTGRKKATIVAIPMSPGDVLLFDGMIPHGTPANQTASNRRRALQHHYKVSSSTISSSSSSPAANDRNDTTMTNEELRETHASFFGSPELANNQQSVEC